jgi:hypothetical protein
LLTTLKEGKTTGVSHCVALPFTFVLKNKKNLNANEELWKFK